MLFSSISYLQKNSMNTINPFIVGEDTITQQIHNIHGSYVQSYDANSLFILVASILKQSTEIVDKAVQGDKRSPRVEGNHHKGTCQIPLCLIKSIGCELFSCKDSSAVVAHETTLKILEKVKNYSWEAKATLTLAAFAKEFGELLHIGEAHQQDLLTRSLATLKGSLILPTANNTRKTSIIELNKLIKLTLEVMQKKFGRSEETSYNNRSSSLKPIDVYWIIITLVACASKVTFLTTDEEKPNDLSPYFEKLRTYYLSFDERTFDERCTDEQPTVDEGLGVDGKQRDVERDYYDLLKVLSRISCETMEFLRRLFSTRDSSRRVNLVDCSNHHFRTVEIDVLKKKKVLFFFSRVERCEISTTDLNILKGIHNEKIKKEHNEEQYAIVWVPIADETQSSTQHTAQNELKRLLRSTDFECYSVNSLALHKGSVKFLKEEWHFETSPICVVMDLSLGTVLNLNAFYSIRLWGLDAFPYDKEAEQRIIGEMTWINTILSCEFRSRSPNLISWVKRDDYIIIHGGMDMVWSKEVEEKVTYLRRVANIKIERFDINEERQVKEQFWSGVSTLVGKYKAEYAKQQVERLNSLRQTEGWFMLNKGSTTLVVGSRETFLKVVKEFHMWKESIYEMTFEVAFKEYHEKIFMIIGPQQHVLVPIQSPEGCTIIENPLMEDRKTLLKEMNCPTCGRDMEMTSVTFKCCHGHNVSKLPINSYDQFDY